MFRSHPLVAVPALTLLAQKFNSLLTSWMSSEWQKGEEVDDLIDSSQKLISPEVSLQGQVRG